MIRAETAEQLLPALGFIYSRRLLRLRRGWKEVRCAVDVPRALGEHADALLAGASFELRQLHASGAAVRRERLRAGDPDALDWPVTPAGLSFDIAIETRGDRATVAAILRNRSPDPEPPAQRLVDQVARIVRDLGDRISLGIDELDAAPWSEIRARCTVAAHLGELFREGARFALSSASNPTPTYFAAGAHARAARLELGLSAPPWPESESELDLGADVLDAGGDAMVGLVLRWRRAG